jgi:hypothetical protein
MAARCFVPLNQLTDEEIEDRLPRAFDRQAALNAVKK